MGVGILLQEYTNGILGTCRVHGHVFTAMYVKVPDEAWESLRYKAARMGRMTMAEAMHVDLNTDDGIETMLNLPLLYEHIDEVLPVLP